MNPISSPGLGPRSEEDQDGGDPVRPEVREAIREHQEQVHRQLVKWLSARHGVSALHGVEGHPAGSEGDEGDSPEMRNPPNRKDT